MRKRPQIKGKGADIYLGGESNEGPDVTGPEKAEASDRPDTEAFSEPSAKFKVFGLEGLQKAAAWLIESGENAAGQAIDFQVKITDWTKGTPLGPLFELQTSISRKCVECTASAARKLWQIP
jgi:hypothetical protein